MHLGHDDYKEACQRSAVLLLLRDRTRNCIAMQHQVLSLQRRGFRGLLGERGHAPRLLHHHKHRPLPISTDVATPSASTHSWRHSAEPPRQPVVQERGQAGCRSSAHAFTSHDRQRASAAAPRRSRRQCGSASCHENLRGFRGISLAEVLRKSWRRWQFTVAVGEQVEGLEDMRPVSVNALLVEIATKIEDVNEARKRLAAQEHERDVQLRHYEPSPEAGMDADGHVAAASLPRELISHVSLDLQRLASSPPVETAELPLRLAAAAPPIISQEPPPPYLRLCQRALDSLNRLAMPTLPPKPCNSPLHPAQAFDEVAEVEVPDVLWSTPSNPSRTPVYISGHASQGPRKVAAEPPRHRASQVS